MTIAEQITRAKADYDEVYQAGKNKQWNDFWDAYQNYGNRVDYASAFYNLGWNDTTYKPKYPIIATVTDNIFAFCKITDTIVPIDITGCTKTAYMFAGTWYNLVTIRELKFAETTPIHYYMFENCKALANLTITGTIGQSGLHLHWSERLTKASITSVINALSTTTSGLAVEFSLTAVNKAFETSEGANDGSTSTEWTTLIATKSNWTISLI